jgi:molybdopterin molybdotransferase
MLVRSPDEREELAKILFRAAETSDLVITIGGVSVGDYDFVKETLERLGEIKFWKVAIKPGKPLAFGYIRGKPLFGLPGNPVSAMVTFDIFVRPAIKMLSGCVSPEQLKVEGKVLQDIKHKKGRREFVRAKTVWRDGEYVTTPTGEQGSGRLMSMLGANSYIVIDESSKDIADGQLVDIILFERAISS